MDDPVLHPGLIRSNVTPPEGRSLSDCFCLEIFAGSGKLTAALRSVGLRDSFGIDVKLPPHLRSPIIKYDLLKPEHLTLVQDLIASPFCVYVHFARGTSSRARLIQRKGRWNPPILRTERHPNGIPGLSGVLLTRVQAANELYQITCDLVEFCIQHGKYVSVENPGRSFMWLTTSFRKLCKKFPLKEVFFHHCRYGSSRRKLTKFLHNITSFQLLESYCDNSHTHEPWGQSPAGHWRTSEETAYPWDLCRAIASKLALQLQEDGFRCQPPAFATQEAGLQTMRATTSLQPRRGLPPMVPEFKQIITHPANLPLPSNSRKLSTPHQGIHASENGCSSHSPSGLDTEHAITVGVHHTPEEFVKQALAIGHPTRFHSFFPDEMNEVVQYCAHSTPGDLARERTEEIKR